MSDLTAWDLRFNIIACIACVLKRGHPNVFYEEDEGLFRSTYRVVNKDYHSPDEVLNDLGLIHNTIFEENIKKS